MRRYTEQEMYEMRAYLIDFVDTFEPNELARAIQEGIISIEEIEVALRNKLYS